MLKIEIARQGRHKPLASAAAITLAVAAALCTVGARAQNAEKKPESAKSGSVAALVGDAERGAEHFEATCAECHGASATAPTLRGIIDRPVASVKSFYGYSMALKEKSTATWTLENLDAYLKSPPTWAPGNLMYREYPDAQMRADVIAFLATLPPPK